MLQIKIRKLLETKKKTVPQIGSGYEGTEFMSNEIINLETCDQARFLGILPNVAVVLSLKRTLNKSVTKAAGRKKISTDFNARIEHANRNHH